MLLLNILQIIKKSEQLHYVPMLIYEAPQSQDTPCKDPFVTEVTWKNITLLLVCCRKALINN